MSVLNTSNPITPTRLFNRGYWRDGWGSPHTRKTKNTKMYETVVPDPKNRFRTYHIMWFPRKFEGHVNPGTTFGVDVRSRCLVEFNDKYYLSAIIKTMEDLDVFVDAVFNKRYPDVRMQLRSGELMYEGNVSPFK